MESRLVTWARSSGLALALAWGALFLGGCPKSAPPPSDQSEQQVAYVHHTVKYSGETLAVISSWYTANSRNWETILKHNPGLNPKRIRIGNVILIPRALVVKSEPMPEKFLRAATPKLVPTTAPAVGEQPAEPNVIEREPAGDLGAAPAQEEPAKVEPPSEPTTIVAPTPEAIQALKPTAEAAAAQPPSQQEQPVAAATPPPPAAAAASSPVPAGAAPGERKIKTRDELLKELLEE